MGAVLGFSCKPASPQKKYTAEARDKLVKAGGGERKNNACLLLLLVSKKLLFVLTFFGASLTLQSDRQYLNRLSTPDQTVRGSVFDQGVSCTRCMMVEV